MMMWTGLLASIAAVPLMWGVGPEWGLWAAFAALFTCFATFCLLYDEPVRKARSRVEARLAGMSSKGLMSEEFQRLQSTPPEPTATERKMTMGSMMLLHLAAGAAGAVFAIWGIMLRL